MNFVKDGQLVNGRTSKRRSFAIIDDPEREILLEAGIRLHEKAAQFLKTGHGSQLTEDADGTYRPQPLRGQCGDEFLLGQCKLS